MLSHFRYWTHYDTQSHPAFVSITDMSLLGLACSIYRLLLTLEDICLHLGCCCDREKELKISGILSFSGKCLSFTVLLMTIVCMFCSTEEEENRLITITSGIMAWGAIMFVFWSLLIAENLTA